MNILMKYLPYKDVLKDGSLYMRRFYLLKTRWFSVFLHYLAKSDEDRFNHCHPWNWIAILLTGTYVEEDESGYHKRWPLWPRFRKAEYSHRLHLSKPIWTLFIHFRRRRRWGFWTDKGWVDAAKYFKTGTEIYNRQTRA